MYLFIFLCTFVLEYVHSSIVCDPNPGTPVNEPMGIPKGLKPGRVAWSFNTSCCDWDGLYDGWYDHINQEVVDQMLERLVIAYTEKSNLFNAWDSMFKWFNEEYYGVKNQGYSKGEKIAMKVNLNGNFLKYGNNNGNQISPQFIKALIAQLVHYVGVQQEDITIYDSSRMMSPYYVNVIHVSFPDVQFVDNLGGIEGTVKAEPDYDSNLWFSNEEVPLFNVTKVPTCVTASKYLMILNNFRGHHKASVTISGKNFFGSIFRPVPEFNCNFGELEKVNYWCPKSLHNFIFADKHEMGEYNPIVDLLGHKELGGKALCVFTGGLYGGPANIQVEGMKLEPVEPCPFMSMPFNGTWSSSLFLSQDPIAMDSVVFDFLRNEPNVPLAEVGCADNYLHEAAQANDPPSKTVYRPNGPKSIPLSSLGVHEHWNNANEKKYSGNMGKKKGGIELIQVN